MSERKMPLYVHIPFCKKKCAYCDFFSVPCASVPDSYLDALLAQARVLSEILGCSWRTVYVGGGTPSLLSAGQIGRLLENLVGADCEECTVEMNPDDITEEMLRAARDSGATRLSVGVQSLCDSALEASGRRCTRESTLSGLNLLKKFWRGRLSLDVISGLPCQTDEEFAASLGQILSFEPDHVSLYALTLEEGTPLERQISSGSIPYDEDAAASQWILGRDLLAQEGFFQYEVSNFAPEGCESLHNSLYWTQEDYAALGAGGCGTFYCGISGLEKDGLRYTNTRGISEYEKFWLQKEIPAEIAAWPCEREVLPPETKEFEFLMTGLRTLKGINSAEYERRFSSMRGLSLEQRLSPVSQRISRRKAKSGWDYFFSRDELLFLNSHLLSLAG